MITKKKKIVIHKKGVSLKKNSIKKVSPNFKKFKLPKNIYPKKYIILFPQPNKRISLEEVKFNFYLNKIKLEKLDKYFLEHKELIKKKDNIERLSEIVGGDKLVKLTKYLNFHDFTSNANVGNTPLMYYNIDLNFGWTNAWRKMYEMIQELRLVDIGSKKLTHFDMCGFPGAFVFATNHYVKTKTNIKEYDWYINSFKEELKEGDIKQKYLRDKFNLQKKYQDRFLYGTGNGDITEIENIKEYINFYQDKDVDLVSSDCGLQIKWNESYLREEQMIKIHFGQFVCGISILKKGGHFVMKNYSQMKPLSISIIYLMILIFNKVYLVKPESSRQYGNEIYLVGKDFKKNLSKAQLEELLILVGKLENSKNINHCLFQNMDTSLVRSIEDKLTFYYKQLKKNKENKDKLYEVELFSLGKNPELVEKKLKHLKECSKYQLKGYFKNYFRKLKYQRIKKGDKLL